MTQLECGFGERDITPRVGVELAGYGAFRHRYATDVRDRLECRAMALRLGEQTLVYVSCDLGSLNLEISTSVRKKISEAHGIPYQNIVIQATHTHSGPSLRKVWMGWGAPDEPYLEILPHRIYAAAEEALDNLQPAELRYAAVPCSGIGINREYDIFNVKDIDAVARDGWQPEKPELTDPTCHVLCFYQAEQLRGIVSSYGCHPVIGGPGNTLIHGDWPGLAIHALEQEHPDCCAMFLQGAQGDINSAITAADGERMERGLQILSQRFYDCIERGVSAAKPLEIQQLGAVQSLVHFSRKEFPRAKLEQELQELEAFFASEDCDDDEHETRIQMVKLGAVRYFLDELDQGNDLNPAIEVQGLGIGPLRLLCAPFEIQSQIKRDTEARSGDQDMPPLILGLCNNSFGYAIDDTVAARGGYAADMTPYISCQLPFANIHQELVQSFEELDKRLIASGHRSNSQVPA